MNTRYIKLWICCSLMLATTVKVFSQTDETNEPAADTEKKYYSFDKLNWYNPWLNGMNAAGLGINNGLPSDYRNFSVFDLNYIAEQGDFRSPFDAGESNHFNLFTQSIQKFNKLSVLGYFKYIYEKENNARWNTLYEPNSTPFWYGDSIPGGTTEETFMTGLKASQQIGDKLLLGLSLDYTSTNKAKKKDLRNLIQRTTFSIIPSLVYQAENVNIGLDLGYRRLFDYTQIMQVGYGSNLPVFIINGMWFGNATIFSSTHSRKTEEHKGIANVYFDLKIGDLRFYNQVGAQYSMNHIYEKFEEFGDYENLKYNVKTQWQYKDNWQLEGEYNISQGIGIKIIQRTEYDSASGSSHYYTKDRVPSYYQEESHLGLALSYRQTRANSFFNEDWKIRVGLHIHENSRKNVSYPNEFRQKMKSNTYEISFAKNFIFGKSSIDISPLISYRIGSGDTLRGIDLSNQQNITPDESWYLRNQLEQEYNHATADLFQARLSLQYSYLINERYATKAYIRIQYNYTQALSGELNNQNRTLMNFSLGFTF